MTTEKKSMQDFLDQLEFDTEFYDVYSTNELTELAKDFMESYDIELHTDCDYRNDQNESGHYYCDLASERADGHMDIYNYELRKNAGKFSEFIEEAMSEFGYDKSRGLIGIFQLGQYLYYSRLSWYILNELVDYMKEV